MTEQQAYTLVERRPDYEIRRYDPHWVAQVQLHAGFEQAGTSAFGRLVGYIGGRNAAGESIAMTAPVIQAPASNPASSIGAPDAGGRDHVVSFVLPASMTAATPPAPKDPGVALRLVPEELAAVASFSGRWTWHSFNDHAQKLLAALARDGVEVAGAPRYARFNPPWTPWFMRRNEVVVPIGEPPAV